MGDVDDPACDPLKLGLKKFLHEPKPPQPFDWTGTLLSTVYYVVPIVLTCGLIYLIRQPGRKTKKVELAPASETNEDAPVSQTLVKQPEPQPEEDADEFPWETVVIIAIVIALTIFIGFVGFSMYQRSADDDEYDVEAPRKLESKATPSVVDA